MEKLADAEGRKILKLIQTCYEEYFGNTDWVPVFLVENDIKKQMDYDDELEEILGCSLKEFIWKLDGIFYDVKIHGSKKLPVFRPKKYDSEPAQRRLVFQVDKQKEDDLQRVILMQPRASFTIPEFGFVTGESHSIEIETVECILERHIINLTLANREDLAEIVANLQEVVNGEKSCKIVINDRSGKSLIYPSGDITAESMDCDSRDSEYEWKSENIPGEQDSLSFDSEQLSVESKTSNVQMMVE